MNNLLETGGMAELPFQTEVLFVASVFKTTKALTCCIWKSFLRKQIVGAVLVLILLACYIGIAVGINWIVFPWFKELIMAEFMISPFWILPVKGFVHWCLGKMAATINRRITLKS